MHMLLYGRGVFSAQIHFALTKPEQMGEEFIQCSWEHFQIKAGSVQLSLKLLCHFTSKVIKLWVDNIAQILVEITI